MDDIKEILTKLKTFDITDPSSYKGDEPEIKALVKRLFELE